MVKAFYTYPASTPNIYLFTKNLRRTSFLWVFVSGHLGFFLPFQRLDGAKVKHDIKFGENRMNGSKVIEIFANFEVATGIHLAQ